MHRTGLVLVSTLLAVAALVVAAPDALADFPQHRVTHFGPDGDLDKQAAFPDVAFNTRTREYLVVYEAGSAANDDHWAIFGQRVSTAGKPVGHRIRISSPTDRLLCSYEPPTVEYARSIDQFLVTWDAGTASDCEGAIYVRRISGEGELLDRHETRISDRGYNDIETSLPAYSPQRAEWMVVWTAEGPDEAGGIQNLWGQRLNAAGSEVGANDRQLTDPVVGNFDADDAVGLAYDQRDRRYLAVVRGRDGSTVGFEVFGHLMNAKGAPIGVAQFRISHVIDTNASGEARPPSVAYDPAKNRFLVAWTGNPQIDAMAADEFEIFGRFVRPDGSLVGSEDVRFSSVGPDGDPNFWPVRPRIEFNPFLGQFLFAWAGDNDTEGGVDEESDIWGQRVAGDGDLIGAVGFRISSSGPDGNTNFAANRPALAFDPSNCGYLVVWSSGNIRWGGPNQEWEIWDNTVPSRCPRG